MDVLIGIISVIVIIYLLWQRQELTKFQVTQYEMESIQASGEIKIAVVSDLHCFTYGKGNERLLQAVKNAAPDLILIPGDLIVTAKTQKYGIALDFARALCTLSVPVFFSNGNHESKAGLADSDSYLAYQQYERKLRQYGVKVLNNESCELSVRGTAIRVSGVELPLSCYKKGRKPVLEEGGLSCLLGTASKRHLQILLAHHPAFAEQYAAWGADLAVCGHNHGGLVSIPGLGSIVSPQFVPFPKYDAGEFTVDGRKIYISRGLGTHTFHIRVFNRAELLFITVKPKNKSMGECYGTDSKTGVL
ncbi:MAG: metallophosphoesterase [Eubacterium sp.]|nr:metallophosphoesterase [Eubacterium sp.]